MQTQGSLNREDRFDLSPIFAVVWKWKFVLLGVLLVSSLVTYFVVKSIDPLYESHTVLYPSKSNTRDKQLEEFSFGYEVHSERLVQLLNSQLLLDSLIDRFDLANIYHVDMSRPEAYDNLIEQSRQRILFHKTRYSSVVISVQDEDPVLAADIANEAARLINVVYATVIKENAATALAAAEKEYRQRALDISQANDSIKVIQDLSVTETEAILRARIAEKERRIKGLRKILDDLRKEHQIYDYSFQVNILNEELAEARSLYLQEQGRLEVLEPILSPTDSTVVNSKARKKGAKKRMDHFQSQLNELARINASYNSSVEDLEAEQELLLESKLQLETITNSLEPEIQVRSLNEMESDYNWDQVQLRELQRNYQRALNNYLDPVPVAYVISKAIPSFKPIYPKVPISVMLGGFGSFSLALVLLSMVERRRRVA